MRQASDVWPCDLELCRSWRATKIVVYVGGVTATMVLMGVLVRKLFQPRGLRV